MYKDILLAVDLEDKSSWEKAAPTAVEYAKVFGATIHVMTVVPDFGMSIVGSFFPEGFESKALETAKGRLHDWATENIPDGITVQHIIGHGRAYEEILRIAAQTDCDLVVLGARHPDNEKYLLGPNSARVVRHATQSVLVVRN